MSLTPVSRENARALAHLLEQERNNLAWWKLPAYDPAGADKVNPEAVAWNQRQLAAEDKRHREARRRYYLNHMARLKRKRKAA